MTLALPYAWADSGGATAFYFLVPTCLPPLRVFIFYGPNGRRVASLRKAYPKMALPWITMSLIRLWLAQPDWPQTGSLPLVKHDRKVTHGLV